MRPRAPRTEINPNADKPTFDRTVYPYPAVSKECLAEIKAVAKQWRDNKTLPPGWRAREMRLYGVVLDRDMHMFEPRCTLVRREYPSTPAGEPWVVRVGKRSGKQRNPPPATASLGAHRLDQWLRQWDLPSAWLAQKLQIYSSNISNWIMGSSLPMAAIMKEIEKTTEGFVTVDHWTMPSK